MSISIGYITALLKTYHWEIILGVCALILVYISGTELRKSRRNFPRGPIGLPLLGYFPFLTKDVYKDFVKLGKKYGDVFSIKIGSQDVVILNGRNAIIEACSKPEFLGRPPTSTMLRVVKSSAFFGCNFLLWKEQRNIVLKAMKELGLGNKKIEENILDEINHFLDVLRSSNTQPIDIRKPLSFSISNVMGSLIFGKKFEYNDPKHQFLFKNKEEMVKNFKFLSLDLVFPWIRYFPFARRFIQYYKSKSTVKNFAIYFRNEIIEHLKTLNSDHIRDFIDQYVVEIDKRRAKFPSTCFKKTILMNNVLDLFVTGTETVLTTLLWFIYNFAAFPDVQKKVRDEIMGVIGPEKKPEYADIRNMPYTHAVILETMRKNSAIPLSFVRCVLADTTVGGYNLQKGDIFFINLFSMHCDPRNWDEPEKFHPERFLSKDGKSLIKPSYLLPFLAGRRACPGESMANIKIFLYIISTVREFNIVFPNGAEPNFEGEFCLIQRPKPYLVQFIPKKSYFVK